MIAVAVGALLAVAFVSAEPLLHTSKGVVRGETINGVTRFLSIPFAAPPGLSLNRT